MAKRKKKKKTVIIRLPIWKDYTFKEVFSDPEITKTFLESLLGVKLQELTYIHAEEEIRPDGKGRNIRQDILAVDENGVVYDIEMQGENLDVIPYRYRANGSGLDSKLIKKGIKPSELKQIPKRYVIFICRKDPFGRGLKQYTIYNTIHETGQKMEDKTELICLNASGTKGEVPVDIGAFLNYVKSGKDDGTNAFVHRIHRKVIELNQDKRFVRRGMTLEQKMEDRYDAGLDKGIQGTVEILREDGYSDSKILERITGKYNLSKKQAEQYLR